jgi:hypothetical protein
VRKLRHHVTVRTTLCVVEAHLSTTLIETRDVVLRRKQADHPAVSIIGTNESLGMGCQGVRAAPRAAHRANQADTDDKEGLGGWRRRAPVGRHAQGEGRAVGIPPDRPCHHMRGQNCRPERLWTAPPRRLQPSRRVRNVSMARLRVFEAVLRTHFPVRS